MWGKHQVNFVKWVYILFFTLFLLPFMGKGQQILKESFDYMPHATNGLDVQSGGQWSTVSGAVGNAVLVTGNSLAHANVVSSANKISLNGASGGYYRSYPNLGQSAVYISCLLRLTALPVSSTGDYFVYISNGTGVIAPVYIRVSATTGKFNIGIAKRSGAAINWLQNELAQNAVYHIVFSYTAVEGANNDYVRLWLNPDGINEPNADVTAAGNGDVGNLANNNRLTLGHGTTNNAEMAMELDEIRVSVDWEQLNPLSDGLDHSVFVANGSLSYTGLRASTGNKITFGTEEGAYYRPFVGQTSGTLYSSFILNITSLPNAIQSDYITCLGSGTELAALVYLRTSTVAGKFNVGLAKNLSSPVSWLPDDLDINMSHYLVFSYTSVNGNTNDKVKLWLNPIDFMNEPIANAEISNDDDITDFLSIDRLLIYNGITAKGGMGVEMDELKISTSWAELALPVQLANFMVKAINNTVQISWVTLSENNNDYFEIGHSADGENFRFLKQIKSKGMTASRNEYTVYDNTPVKGMNYYRLAQTDKDGTKKDLGIKAVSFKIDNSVAVNVYPNPAKERINVSFENFPFGNVQLVLSTVSGQLVHRESIKINTNAANYPLHLLNMPPSGTYVLKVIGSSLNKSIKLVVQ